MKKIKILDCTCRDGGYYNLWNFKISEINKYLLSCSRAGIDIVEVGFVFPKKKDNYGLFAYSKKSLFKKLRIPDNLSICVMINGKDFYDKEKESNQAKNRIKAIFKKSKFSKFKIVRIAINFDDFKNGKEISQELKKLGYKVGLNLMQSHNKNYNQIANVAKTINKWAAVDFLYFADSIGSMNSAYVSYFCKTLRKFWKKDIGIHAHNNKSFALSNTLEAIKTGATMVDSTILGMGRGAGNVCTESLLIELKSKKYKYKPQYLTNILPYFEGLRDKYKWGPNYFYHFAAVNNIHPTYIQKIISLDKYDNNFISNILENLAKKNSSTFKEDCLDNEVYNTNNNQGSFDAKDFFKNQNILIVGSGDSGKLESKKVERFIKRFNPTVISLNINPYLSNKRIDYYVSCFDFRVYFELLELLKKRKPIITPVKKFKKDFSLNLKKDKIINYDLIVKKNSFKSFANYCEIDKPLALTYALAFCQAANPQNINLAFIDVYKNNTEENKYLIKIIKKFQKKNKKKINFI